MRILAIIFLVGLVLFSFSIPVINSDVYANSTIKVSVDIIEPAAIVEISPNEIYFGNVTSDYETELKNITVTNVGTMDVRISPALESGADEIFNYIKLASASCSSWSNITKWNSSIISHSKNYSVKNGDSYNFCMKLDLTDYKKEITLNKSVSTNLAIWVIPA